jgi:hypothetical protein
MAALVELIIVPEVNELAAVPLDIPERPVTAGAVQVYVVPVGTIFPLFAWSSAGATVACVPEQIAGETAAIDGLGFTVTATLNAVPAQLPEVGVTAYVTTIAALVEFTNVPDANELAAVPACVPVMPVTVGADHVYVVPNGTIFPLFVWSSAGVTVASPPEQITGDTAAIDGFGLTVNATLNAVPVQLPDDGVTE